jgi:hypothetical protein
MVNEERAEGGSKKQIKRIMDKNNIIKSSFVSKENQYFA